jgi:predicted short-subunit dehydrogenase-like oxidoreductase (DUF2520 family)
MAAIDDRPGRLSIGLVSAGRAGTPVAAAWQAVGHRVVAVSAVSDASVERARALLPETPVRAPQDVATDVDLLLLAVPDDVLPLLVDGLAVTGTIRPGTWVVHLSGAHGLGVLDPVADRGALPLALHPAMTFTGTSIDIDRLDGCPWAVSAPDGMRAVAEALVVETGGEPEWIPDDRRTLYHAALCHAANHFVTLVAQSQELLGDAGVGSPQRFLAPLLSATLDNALRSGDGALTGPVARGDAGTVGRHLEVVRGAPDVDIAYRALARATMLRAARDGRLAPDAVAALRNVLEPEASE